MKPWLQNTNRIWNALFFIVLIVVLYLRVPHWLANYETQGQKAGATSVVGLDGQNLSLPTGKKAVVVFWATWCPPCKVELARLNRMVNSGSLAPSDVIAVSVGEDPKLVADEIQKREYKFTVAIDPQGQVANLYQVNGTPTILLIDEQGTVHWKTVGLSPTLEMRVSSFFK